MIICQSLTDLFRRIVYEIETFKAQWFNMVAFDGVGLYRWNEKHCNNCLYVEIKEGKKDEIKKF